MSEGRVEEVLTWLRQLEEDAGGWPNDGTWVVKPWRQPAGVKASSGSSRHTVGSGSATPCDSAEVWRARYARPMRSMAALRGGPPRRACSSQPLPCLPSRRVTRVGGAVPGHVLPRAPGVGVGLPFPRPWGPPRGLPLYCLIQTD